jgi:hypothetical protein
MAWNTATLNMGKTKTLLKIAARAKLPEKPPEEVNGKPLHPSTGIVLPKFSRKLQVVHIILNHLLLALHKYQEAHWTAAFTALLQQQKKYTLGTTWWVLGYTLHMVPYGTLTGIAPTPFTTRKLPSFRHARMGLRTEKKKMPKFQVLELLDKVP